MSVDNLISVREVALLLKCEQIFVRQLVENGKIPGVSSTNANRRTFKIPRMAFYKQIMGWETDEEIRQGYKNAGIELKEKADAGTSTKQLNNQI